MTKQSVGVVVIGRNEGARLVGCLEAILRAGVTRVVYVDSNSTDDSVGEARRRGVDTIVLAKDVPFTAARARNSGARRVVELWRDVEFLQFVDGDVELDAGWLSRAADYLRGHDDVAVVTGRLRERHPEASVYNRLGDMEWAGPVGEMEEFGGIAMIRAEVFFYFGGYDEGFIAGEEPDLAARLRKTAKGEGRAFRIVRIGGEMGLHDLAMTRFGQWWKRAVRSGHAMGQLYDVHGGEPLFFYRKQVRSTLFWAGAVPAGFLGAAVAGFVVAGILGRWWWGVWWVVGMVVLMKLGYAALVVKIARHRKGRGDGWGAAMVYGFFTVVGKWAQLRGVWTYYGNKRRGLRTKLMEYKAVPAPQTVFACGHANAEAAAALQRRLDENPGAGGEGNDR